MSKYEKSPTSQITCHFPGPSDLKFCDALKFYI